MRLLFFLLCLLIPTTTYASDGLKHIPVQHHGRIKPMDSFARTFIKDINGSEKHALKTLEQILFDPANAASKPLFVIKDQLIKQRLALPEKQKHFSLLEIQQAINTIPPEMLEQEETLAKLAMQIAELNQLLRSFSAFLPLQLDLPEAYKIVNPTYRALLPHEPQIMADVKALIKAKGEDPTLYTDEERKLAFLAFSLRQISDSGAQNSMLRVIPSADNPNILLSPWQAMLSGMATPDSVKHFTMWEKLIKGESPKITAKPSTRFKLETLTNKLKPFNIAMALYALTMIIALIKPRLSLPIISAAALIHAIGIAARIIILDRPPVGTLYESVLFVSLICAVTAIILRRAPLALPAGSFSAIGLLAIAPILISKSDSMDMLVAVLNTNFWLTTHVLIITAGYGICVLAALFAHAALLPRFNDLKDTVYKLSVLALLLTAVGTALGGIWADQSWGRFWGWDPKENGALLIVLWLIWLQHGRRSGKLNNRAFHAGIACLSIIVALAWFGINLLNVGLHSYGFTTGLATALGAFCMIELIIIGTLWRHSYAVNTTR